ncbi:hypothetical protein M2650_16080 [Luteimonas sp. SX5]|uniref:Uncharacterized protein n=1 Tax=Luteimonas galliterrae TaxID=2940486 RepID=A0ABT0MMP2_9GAMM|nr:hypothetical protein [Luteimonas galliterrae]MCL1636141.1 hypothetical protein [Luteimonas galliterrae]
MKLHHSSLCLIALLTVSSPAFSCSPPLALWLGPEGPKVPYQYPSHFAFLGKVVGYTTTSTGDPALSLLVLDAWTNRQVEGQVIDIGVAQWQGCNLSKPMGKPFHPETYPIGTRLRIIAREQTMFTWDVDAGILVLGTGS